ncbi:hypothetical protein [Streptomyces sp. NPDC057617]|uniref:hypothetical protein n=1 Tax=Streptomyces sp. NPDC057617 TaxID=3346184 RepID=UPI00368A19B9
MGAADWERACERAEEVTACYLDGSGNRRSSWDWTAVSGVLAVSLAALGKQTVGGVDAVGLGTLAWHVHQEPFHLRALAASVVGAGLASGTDTDPATVAQADDPLVARWLWLTRTWPEALESPDVGAPPRWDGLYRRIDPDRSEPAVDVCASWAAASAGFALVRERGAGLGPETRVRITAGEYDGRPGTVIFPVWDLDDHAHDVRPGPPQAYLVRSAVRGTFEPVLVEARALETLAVEDEPAPFGADATFTSVWDACRIWAEGLVDWHRAYRPGDYDGRPEQEVRLVLGFVTVALFEAARDAGLHVPADGSAVSRTPLVRAVDLMPAQYAVRPRVAELIARVAREAQEDPLLEDLRGTWALEGPEARALQYWVLGAAHMVLAENTSQMRVTAGITPVDLLELIDQGDLRVTLADRAEDLTARAQERTYESIRPLFDE